MKKEFIYNEMPIKLGFKEATKEILSSKIFIEKLKAKLDNNEFSNEDAFKYAVDLLKRRTKWVEVLEGYIESFGK